jgi:hypothetical protein
LLDALDIRQGCFVALPIVSSVVGVALVGIGTFSCAIVDDYSSDDYYFRIGNCEGQISSFVFANNPARVASFALSIAAAVFGTLTALCAIHTAFMTFPPRAFVGMSIGSLGSAALGAAACGVLFFSNDCRNTTGFTCTVDEGLYVAIGGISAWMAAGVSFLFVNRHKREGRRNLPKLPDMLASAVVGVDFGGDADSIPNTAIETVTSP